LVAADAAPCGFNNVVSPAAVAVQQAQVVESVVGVVAVMVMHFQHVLGYKTKLLSLPTS